MAKEEYLNNFRSDLLSGSLDQMLADNRPQDKNTLVEYLKQALENLKNVPGPHLQYRIGHADDWIGWWVNFLKTDRASGQLIPFDKIKSNLDSNKKYGVLFAGGFEGHGGHRFAANWMRNFVSPILLLESDWYVEEKSRGGPYLDLRARVSMWAHFNPNNLVSVLPKKPEGISDEMHYKSLFDRTEADYCFASKSDPLRQQKIARGKSAPFLLIPDMYIQRTTDKVEKLAPDIDLETLWRLINTTDHVEKLMSDGKDEIEY